MLKHLALSAAALTLLAAPAASADEREPTKGEAKLAKLIEGRVPGDPQSCIRTVGSRNLTQIDGTALVYRDGRTLWVNRTRNPDSIDDNDIMLIKRFSGSQLCRTDQIQLIDRVGGFLTGILFLDDFVPYRLPDTEG